MFIPFKHKGLFIALFLAVFSTTTMAQEFQKIRLGFEDNTGFHRQLLLAFIPGTTHGSDFGYDAELIDDQNNDAYWVIDEDRYVIQSIPPIETEDDIKLGVDIQSAGETTFMIDALENIDETMEIYLMDHFLNKQHNLREVGYTAHVDLGNYNERFSLKIVQQTNILGVSDIELNNIKLHYNSFDKTLMVNNASHLQIDRIELYDLAGKKLQSQSVDSVQNKNFIPFEASGGIYIANIHTDKGIASKKFIKK